jgi:hypothetical protein
MRAVLAPELMAATVQGTSGPFVGARGEIVESDRVSPISPPCLLVNLGSAERFLRWIMLRIPRHSSHFVNVLPQLINVESASPAASAGPPTSGQRQAAMLRDTSRESRKLRPGAQQIEPGRVHALT